MTRFDRFFDQKNPDPQFIELRTDIHKQLDIDTAKRIERDPIPTEEEAIIGAYKEMLEPQVKDAIFEFLRKGYTPESSGFTGEHFNIQSMDGYFEIDNATREQIENL